MKFHNIYAGSWVPRTTLHLEEFYNFIDQGSSHLKLQEKTLKNLRQDLKVKSCNLSNDGQMIVAKMDKLDFNYSEDGLIIISKSVENLNKDFKYLADFSLNKLFKAFSYLYSVGAPIPKIFSEIFSIMPFIVTVSGASLNEITEIFKVKDEKIIKTIQGSGQQIYFGQELIIINGIKDDIGLIKNLIFIEDCRGQFNKILNLHRFIWEEVDKIKGQEKMPYRKLSATRDTLMELNSEVIFLSSRLSQIKNLLSDRKGQLVVKTKEQKYIFDNLSSLESTGIYLSDLWSMTENNVRVTENLIASLYQESAKKQLNILQVIFVISALASVMALGSIYGFSFSAYDSAGVLLLQGNANSFSFQDLFYFGFSALGLGIIIYIIFFWVYNHISYSKISQKNTLQSQELKNIKKMFR